MVPWVKAALRSLFFALAALAVLQRESFNQPRTEGGEIYLSLHVRA